MNSNSNKLTLENFKVGVDNVIFSIDSSKNRLLVLLVKRSDKPYINPVSYTHLRAHET